MKNLLSHNILFVVCFLLTTSFLFGQETNYKTVYVKDYSERRALVKNNFTGLLITKDGSGERREEMKNGRHHGIYTRVYKEIKEEKNYKDGKPHGLWKFWEKGQLIKKDSFAFGKLESHHEWNAKGLLLEKNELRTSGHFESYYSSGQLKHNIRKTKSGTQEEEFYSKEGVLLQKILKGDSIRYPLAFTKKGEIKAIDFFSVSNKKPRRISNEMQRKWGIGFIEMCYVWNRQEQPDYKVLTYDSPGGEINGLLEHDKTEKSFKVLYHTDGIRPILQEDGTGVAEYKTEFYIKFYEEKDGYLRILYHSSPDEGIWVKRSDLEQFFKVLTWIDFASKSIKGLVVQNNYSINVRSGPNVDYEKVHNVKKVNPGMDSVHLFMAPTGKTKGRWVEVKGYMGKACDFNAIEKNKEWKFTGWIKAVDDLGFPNVFRTYCGC